MSEQRRSVPNTEWVLMYRKGIPARKIALLADAPGSTVRYHLALAREQDPTLATTHQQFLPRRPKTTTAGRTNLNEILTQFKTTGRLPSSTGTTSRERNLDAWLQRRRQEANNNTLSPAYAAALNTIPGWNELPPKKDRDETRWKDRLAETIAYRAEGNDWPRHNKTNDPHERQLGIWLHSQRINAHASKLDPQKEKTLDTKLPGWRVGRKRSGGRRRASSIS